ncbi:NAD(P)H-hydrate dehydratase [Maribacter aurantiacus]|uniref:Bifunctional NAD(P)H-hydrate repair enzyme n=1 Tax=Maribacter aurantiacus TaxID=1882343 RepID=A0A5R8M4D0_9FLAO|nr:NAD(P)H-hydrate dehydratase [Maribacter aurantiacus]TLF44482.1 NAD(P)H-hydrate dehydratase [Maribacter aurantiacus]
MKVFTAAQIYKADTFTIEKQQITSDALMERAATQIFNWMHVRMQGAPVKIHLFCGIGNNGGDGIALARHLFEHGYDIAVYVVKYSDKRSKDFLTNLDRLKDRKIWPIYMDADSDLPEIHPNDIIVDAIFGIGLNRTPDAWVAKIIQHLNTSKAFILSVDIPSGLFTDSVPEDKEAVIKANYVLSFQVPKLVFFLPETGIYVEQWEVLDIGLDAEFLMNEKTDFELISKNEVLQFYRPRTKYSHKGTYGHALIVGGSYGKMGAVILTSRAALKAGSGLVTAYVPECGYAILQTAIPEVMVLTNGKEAIEAIEFDMKPTVIGLGIGMGIHDKTVKALEHFLKANKLPLVLDADALNILSKNQDQMDFIPENSILTPHPKELERLVGKWKDDFEKLEKVRQFTDKRKVVIVVKGAHTITFFEGRGYINTTGNPGMATAGSGDALTGIITGLIAQGYSSLQAAIFGVYIHGKSGDISVENTGYQALIASDIIEGIGSAFLDLFKVPEERPDTSEKDG